MSFKYARDGSRTIERTSGREVVKTGADGRTRGSENQ